MESGLQGVSIDLQPRDGKREGGPAPPGYPYPASYAAQGFPVEQPRDFVVWSLFNTFFCNMCCLGFMALVFSFKARDRKVLGDANGAGSYGKTAKCLNIATLILSLLLVVLFIILLATGIVSASNALQQGNVYKEYGK